MREVHDDLGHPVRLDGPAQRVVSLVPSITEALHSVRPSSLVGATDWCTHPADLSVTRVRGTKNPSLEAIRALEPDLVVANKEENRELDVRRLRESGVQVWVTDIETVPQGIASLERLLDAMQWARPAWLDEARSLWCGPLPPITAHVAVAIWRDPWMVVGSSTFAGDLARRLGLENVFGEHPERYPHVSLEELDGSGADVVLLPDEPYVFTPHDGPEAFTLTPTRLVSGRLLTWYGPSLLQAHARLRVGQDDSVDGAGIDPEGFPVLLPTTALALEQPGLDEDPAPRGRDQEATTRHRAGRSEERQVAHDEPALTPASVLRVGLHRDEAAELGEAAPRAEVPSTWGLQP